MENKDDKYFNYSKEELEEAKKSIMGFINTVSVICCGCIRATVFLFIADTIGYWLDAFRLTTWQITFFLWAPLVIVLGIVGSLVAIAYVIVMVVGFSEFIKYTGRCINNAFFGKQNNKNESAN